MTHSPRRGGTVRGGLTLAALGVVFGDIGTSPLYAVQTVFATDAVRPVTVDPVAQRRGTSGGGGVFGPVMLVWFTAIGLCGLRGVIDDPSVLRGLSPT